MAMAMGKGTGMAMAMVMAMGTGIAMAMAMGDGGWGMGNGDGHSDAYSELCLPYPPVNAGLNGSEADVDWCCTSTLLDSPRTTISTICDAEVCKKR